MIHLINNKHISDDFNRTSWVHILQTRHQSFHISLDFTSVISCYLTNIPQYQSKQNALTMSTLRRISASVKKAPETVPPGLRWVKVKPSNQWQEIRRSIWQGAQSERWERLLLTCTAQQLDRSNLQPERHRQGQRQGHSPSSVSYNMFMLQWQSSQCHRANNRAYSCRISI